ncbi:MAG TPA: NAD(P)H-hydrate dehydratase, partial [Methylomirabilota bacterium]|nr:NAD(P)H-hydrate dehydratase [Methylomirabilota bacterium]
MEKFDLQELKKLYIPQQDSHKGQNGKLMVIGGSHLFHAASLWALTIASRIVDMVFYSSVPENNLLVEELKKDFRNGIIVRRDDIEAYIEEADAVLIGPGMVRTEVISSQLQVINLEEINRLKDEGEQSYYLTKYLIEKYPHKKWIIDAGALQMMEPEWLKDLSGNAILTPHLREFERIFGKRILNPESGSMEKIIGEVAKEYNTIILLKGK